MEVGEVAQGGHLPRGSSYQASNSLFYSSFHLVSLVCVLGNVDVPWNLLLPCFCIDSSCHLYFFFFPKVIFPHGVSDCK